VEIRGIELICGQGSNVESVIPNLFEGRSLTYIESTTEDRTMTVPETFKQIDLDIEGCRDMYDALEKRCQVEKVEGSKVRSLPRRKSGTEL